MSRTRLMLVMAGLIVAVTFDSVSVYGQPPQGRGGRGGGGGAGAGGGGRGNNDNGGGGRGGRGGQNAPNQQQQPNIPLMGLIELAQNDYVQEVLKVSDTQKQSLKKLADDQQARGKESMQRLRQQTDQATTRAQAEAQALAQQQMMMAQANAANAANNQGRADGTNLASQLNGYGFSNYGVNQNQVDPMALQQAAAMQGRMASNAIQSQSWMMMRQAMRRMEQASDQQVARVLDKNQMKRIREIQLQVNGAASVLRDEVAEKIELAPDQAGEIQQTLQESSRVKRDIAMKTTQALRGITPSAPGERGGRRNNNGQAAPAAPDDATLKKALEKPDVRAKVEEAKKANFQVRDREYTQVFKAMDRHQVSTFRKMLGQPFDVEAMNNPLFRALAREKSEKDDAKKKENEKDKDKATAKADDAKAGAEKSDAAAKGTDDADKSAGGTRRPSLRERRGLGQQPSQGEASPN